MGGIDQPTPADTRDKEYRGIAQRREKHGAGESRPRGVKSAKLEVITRYIELKGELSAEQQQRLLAIADRCPVHKTLESDPEIVTRLETA